MSASTIAFPTLAEVLWRGDNKLVRNVFLAVVGSALLWISAKIQVPFYPVPMTMQTFMIMLIGVAYGWRLGAATVILYLAEGAVGLPVFAGTPEKGIGLAYMAGPTGGYLLGFVFSALVMGWLAQRGWDRKVITTAIAAFAATVVIYIPGLLWLGTLIGWDKPVLQFGLVPFLLAAVFKLALIAVLVPLSWQVLKKVRRS